MNLLNLKLVDLKAPSKVAKRKRTRCSIVSNLIYRIQNVKLDAEKSDNCMDMSEINSHKKQVTFSDCLKRKTEVHIHRQVTD